MSVKEHIEPTTSDLREVIESYQPVSNAPAGFLGIGKVRRTFYQDLRELLIEVSRREEFIDQDFGHLI